jgi:aldehyde dehydrogenase (NAD+)
MLQQDEFFIDGAWTAPSGTDFFEVVDPSSEQVIGRVAAGAVQDVDRAVAAARAAFDHGPWPRMSPAERAAVLRRVADGIRERSDEMAEILTAEMGSPITQSRTAQIPIAADLFEYYAGVAGQVSWYRRRETVDPANAAFAVAVRHEPVGVVAAIVPWNGPQILAAMKVAPALLAGCTVVLKPAPEAALNLTGFAAAFQQAGLPAGVLNIVPAGREVGEHLVVHPDVDKVSFTGSTEAGRRIGALCGGLIRRCGLELGGKSAAVVLEDADLTETFGALAAPMMFISGQACNAPTRILAPRSRYADVVEAVTETVRAAPFGDPHDPGTFVGPLAVRRQRDRVEEYVRSGRAEGARVVLGGGRPKGHDVGWYVEKTVFADGRNEMRIAQEEIFGPVWSVLPYDDVDDAVRLANGTPYGLAGSVWTKDLAVGHTVAERLRAGALGVNSHTLDPAAPFGGFKQSGIGRERGIEAVYAFTESKSIVLPTATPEPAW